MTEQEKIKVAEALGYKIHLCGDENAIVIKSRNIYLSGIDFITLEWQAKIEDRVLELANKVFKTFFVYAVHQTPSGLTVICAMDDTDSKNLKITHRFGRGKNKQKAWKSALLYLAGEKK